MAHSLTAKKRIRQNRKRWMRNKSHKSALKTQLRAFADAVFNVEHGGELQQADEAFVGACAALDREADRGIIHKNKAARKKSRLAKRLNTLKAGGRG